MEEKLMDINDLKELLGYIDERSVKKWCDRQRIPILKMGAKKYILTRHLNSYIDSQSSESKTDRNFEKRSGLKSGRKEKTGCSSGYYHSNNEIVAYYLAKYESAIKKS